MELADKFNDYSVIPDVSNRYYLGLIVSILFANSMNRGCFAALEPRYALSSVKAHGTSIFQTLKVVSLACSLAFK